MRAKKSTIIRICGLNLFCQLGEKSNNHDFFIFPPLNFHVNLSMLSSYYLCHYLSIWVTKNGKAYFIGNNHSFSPESLTEDTEIQIIDSRGDPCKIISAISSHSFIAYIVEMWFENKKIALTSKLKKLDPVFLNLNGRKPLALFGGFYTVAVIDYDGEIIFIDESNIQSPFKEIETKSLPNDDRAVSVCIGYELVIALGESGKVYSLDFKFRNFEGIFVVVEELFDKDIVQISGIAKHFFAVCSDGRVFVRGEGEEGSLGLGDQITSSSKFVLVKSLSKYKIVAAYAGISHSLFQTEDGMILGCGENRCGQLFLDRYGEEKIFYPVESTIKSGASFCIAFDQASAVLVGPEIPPNTPNRKVVFTTEKKKKTQNPMTCSMILSHLEQFIPNEIKKIQQVVHNKDEKIYDLNYAIHMLTETNYKYISKINELQNENKKLKEEFKQKNVDTEIKEKDADKEILIKKKQNKRKNTNQPILPIISDDDCDDKKNIKQKKSIDLNNDDVNHSKRKKSPKQPRTTKKDDDEDESKLKQNTPQKRPVILTIIKSPDDDDDDEDDDDEDDDDEDDDDDDEESEDENHKKPKKSSKQPQVTQIKSKKDDVNNLKQKKSPKQPQVTDTIYIKDDDEDDPKRENIPKPHKIINLKIITKKEEEESNDDDILNKPNKSSKASQKASKNREDTKELEIFTADDLFKFSKRRKIGEGLISAVFKVCLSDVTYTLKIFNIELFTPKEIKTKTRAKSKKLSEVDRLFEMYTMINNLNNEHIVKAHAFNYGDEKSSPSILLEYCPYSLKSFIKRLNIADRRRIIVETCEVMRDLHQIGLNHSDLKPENILLDSNKKVKLTDIGLYSIFSINNETDEMEKNVKIQRRRNYKEKADVYAFGAVIYFIVTKGENIFDDEPTVHNKLTDFTQEIIDKCLSKKLNERPSFNQLYQNLKDNEDDLI